MKFFTFLLMLNSFNLYASGDKLTKEFIMKKIDQNSIKFDITNGAREIAIATLMGISNITDPKELAVLGEARLQKADQMIIEDFKQKYYFFDPEMLNLRSIRDGYYRYSITFDFSTTRSCVLRVDKIDMKCGNPICNYNEKDPRKVSNVDMVGQVIPDSYCEKIYGIKIKKQVEPTKEIKGE